MLNSLIPHMLSLHNFNRIDGRGKKRHGVRLLICSLEDKDLIDLGSIENIIEYCYKNNRSVDCYECLDETIGGINNYTTKYNDLPFYKLHRLKSIGKIKDLISLSNNLGYLYYEGKSYCRFVPFIEGSFSIEGNLICYSGEKKMFILPNDNYRHIDVTFYNKVFINSVSGDIIGRYAGLDENKQYIETEERWDKEQCRWVVTKKRIIEIAGCKEYS